MGANVCPKCGGRFHVSWPQCPNCTPNPHFHAAGATFHPGRQWECPVCTVDEDI